MDDFRLPQIEKEVHANVKQGMYKHASMRNGNSITNLGRLCHLPPLQSEDPLSLPYIRTHMHHNPAVPSSSGRHSIVECGRHDES